MERGVPTTENSRPFICRRIPSPRRAGRGNQNPLPTYRMNAVYMLWVRQFKCCARFLPRVIASLGQPLLYPLAMGFRFGPIFKI